MRALTSAEIESLASRPKVRRIAVENFLFSLPLDIGTLGCYRNLANDALAYGWNQATIGAIRDGIRLAAQVN